MTETTGLVYVHTPGALVVRRVKRSNPCKALGPFDPWPTGLLVAVNQIDASSSSGNILVLWSDMRLEPCWAFELKPLEGARKHV